MVLIREKVFPRENGDMLPDQNWHHKQAPDNQMTSSLKLVVDYL